MGVPFLVSLCRGFEVLLLGRSDGCEAVRLRYGYYFALFLDMDDISDDLAGLPILTY